MRKILFILSLILVLTPVFSIHAQVETQNPIKILLVPGHDNEVWGAQYAHVKEAAMNLAVASRIFNILKKDKRFDVYITRDVNGYTKEFADYFTDHQADILAFKENAKANMQSSIASGDFVEKENVPHHTVSPDVALKLYGFNKWANENNVDVMIHIHFNDYPRPHSWTIGKYTGFTIYFPDGELANWKESSQLAANVFIELNKKYHTSTYGEEKGGLIPDQKLIAMGSNGTLNASVRSVLIEYGYIYEKRLRNYTTRHKAYDDMAKATSTGIQKYFFSK